MIARLGGAAACLSRRVRSAPARTMLILGLLGAMPLVVLTPPLQVPDEAQHFARAYELSELKPWGQVRQGVAGDELPASLAAFTLHFLGTSALHLDRAVTAEPLARTLRDLSRKLRPGEKVFVNFAGAAPYSPLPYAPQVLGIALGRLLGLSPLGLFYVARMCNALAAVAALALAVRLVPFGGIALGFVGLLPMGLYEYASRSPDAMTIASVTLFTALTLRAAMAGGWLWREAALAILAGAVFCSLKPVYAPVLLVGAAPAILRPVAMAGALRRHAAIAALALGVALLWLLSSRAAFVAPAPDVAPAAQIRHIAEAPGTYLLVVLISFFYNIVPLFKAAAGVLGWDNIELGGTFYWVALAGLAGAVGSIQLEATRLSRAAACWALAMVAACFFLVMTAMYLIWTPVGALYVGGVQGRYFLPVLPLAALALGALLPRRAPGRLFAGLPVALVALVLAGIAVTDWTVASRYAVF
ncbi:MAG: DUF2142 domain-containing protein [Rhodospirillales bacterium]|nr:DUF2142 domain-containing protein [Rhodospirillales bacterium]